MTVGLCMDIVKIGLAMHLRYIRPYAPVQTTELQPEPLRGGSAPIKPEVVIYPYTLHLLILSLKQSLLRCPAFHHGERSQGL